MEDEVYWVNETLHQALLSMNPRITFIIGNSVIGDLSVDIALSYASFDLQAIPPAVKKASRLFPLRRAANNTQYTLGRTFMQEAYVTSHELFLSI